MNRVDPEIYPLLIVAFTSMAWGGVLMLRKAGQVRLENAALSVDTNTHFQKSEKEESG